MRVRHLMTPHPITLEPQQALDDAERIMRSERIRHLPVVSAEGAIVGLLTQRDLLRARSSPGARLADAMTKAVRTIGPDTPALAAAQLMLDQKFGCLPVVEGDRLVGIVTEADFLIWAISELAAPSSV
jgi:CBS domain-containing protein